METYQTQNKEEFTDNQRLEGIRPMIYSILKGYGGLSREDRLDLLQEVMVYIWQHVIPSYDPERGTKFSSFTYRCAVNFINRKVKGITRDRVYNTDAIETFSNGESEKYDEDTIRKKERVNTLSQIVCSNSVLKHKERVVLTIMMDDPFVTQKKIAEIIGYSHPSAVSGDRDINYGGCNFLG